MENENMQAEPVTQPADAAAKPWMQPTDRPAAETASQPAAETCTQPAAQTWVQPDPAVVAQQEETGKLSKRVRHGRNSLGVLLILSALNMVMIMMDVTAHWPYSVAMPYELTFFVKAMENGFFDGPWDNGPMTYGFMGLGFLVLAVYLLCWIFSKKKGGWLMASAILYTVDSVALVIYVIAAITDPSLYLLDFGFHILALVELYMGAVAQKKLKALQDPKPAYQNPQSHGTCDPEKF